MYLDPGLANVHGYIVVLTGQHQMNQPETKAILSANTDQAFKSGAFGIPWFECTNAKGETEGFWGIDHLGQVVDFLGLDRRLDNGFRAVL